MPFTKKKTAWEAAMTFLLTITSMVLFVYLASGCSAQGDIAARYGDVVVSESEVSNYTDAYRKEIGAESDEAWARYLRGRQFTTKAWREEAIRQIVGRQLVEKRAYELGITADEQHVEKSVAADKSERGIDLSDEASWREALSEEGTTPEDYRERLRYASVLEQVLLAEGDTFAQSNEGLLQEYLNNSLMDRVVRRYSVLSYGPQETAIAKEDFNELNSLSSEALVAAFDGKAADRLARGSDLSQGDLGWNLLYDTSDLLDPNVVIGMEEGTLYPQLVERDGGYQLYLCRSIFVFDSDVTYSSITDESLKKSIARAYILSSWDSWAQSCVSQMVDNAQVEVTPMPANLPYDVDDLIASM